MNTGPKSNVKQMAQGYAKGEYANASSSRFRSDTSGDLQLAFGALTNRVDQQALPYEQREEAFRQQEVLLSRAAQRQADEEASLALIAKLALEDSTPIVLLSSLPRKAEVIDSETLALLAQFEEEDNRARAARLSF